jgi:2,3-bisphosphoglycerate-independent phosphoglycerate mutase
MGNSEVGHMNLGAGRVVYQDFTRITKAIRDGDFFTNPAITDAVDKADCQRIKPYIFGAYYLKVVCIRTKTIYTRW